jgi:putative flavoprotein involved in K+ transport
VQRIDTVVIGAGQAGLAMSRCLSDQGREHVVLERGRTGERWRSQTWDSLHLLTPSWMTRLPGHVYQGPDPEGFMSRDALVTLLEQYAAASAAPVQGDTSVEAVEAVDGGYTVRTDRGTWLARRVVVATGDCQHAHVPAMAASLDPTVHQATTTTYRNPGSLPAGGVLVVGASASGVQLAEELHRAGREVVLAVGSHSRLPRRYRGMDIMWWLDRTGSLDRPVEDLADPAAAAREPSTQLVGRPRGSADPADLDLDQLTRSGVRLAGRLLDVDGHRTRFADDLRSTTKRADEKMARVLDGIDRHAAETGLAAELDEPDRPSPVPVSDAPTALDLRSAGISTVLWATGYRRSYPWLRVPVLDHRGEIVHRAGVTPAPGLYVLGLRFQRRRRSHFIDGAGDDARFVADHIADQADPADRPSIRT